MTERRPGAWVLFQYRASEKVGDGYYFQGSNPEIPEMDGKQTN